MPVSMNRKLLEILNQYALVYIAAIDSDGNLIGEVGNKDDQKSDLPSSLLGPYGEAKNTFECIEGQGLPRLWRQGSNYAMIFKPNDNIEIIAFGTSGNDVLKQVKHSKEIDKIIQKEFKA